jgi:hypothetical protein
MTVATFGVVAGLAGIEHGIGEVLQGNRAPTGLVIQSWPGSKVFQILNGEPALTIIPNLFITGILAILVSLMFLGWAILFVQRRNGGLVLLLLSGVMLLVGGGFGPPLLGMILALAATRIDAPLMPRLIHLSPGLRRVLSAAWPWSLAAALVAWLSLMPGAVLLDYFVGVNNPLLLIPALILAAFGLLLATIMAASAYDHQRAHTQPGLSAITGQKAHYDDSALQA